MRPYTEPAYDDTRCACGRTLPDTVEPWTWHDHGFCSLGCAAACHEPVSVRGEPALELARLGAGRGRGFEEDLIRDWQVRLRATPEGILWLEKLHGPDDRTHASPESWAWRVYLTDRHGAIERLCLGFRLTAKETRTMSTGPNECGYCGMDHGSGEPCPALDTFVKRAAAAQAAVDALVPAPKAAAAVWWVVTLREDGDDEDSLYIVTANDQEEAENASKAQFVEEAYGDTPPANVTLYVNHTVRCGTTMPVHVRAAPT